MSVIPVMAAALDRELRERFNFALHRDSCEAIIGAVIAGTAAVARATESSQPALPPGRPPDGGCTPPGGASAVDFCASAAEQLDFLTGEVRKALAIFNRLPLQEYFRRNAEGDRLAMAIEHASDHLASALNILSAHRNLQQSPSSATPAPRTSDGGRARSGAAPAVTPAQQAYALLWHNVRFESPIVCKARHVLLRSLTAVEQADAIAWVRREHRSGEPG